MENSYRSMRKKLGEFAKRARECENLEARIEDDAVRRTYGELAAHWRKLAVQEENSLDSIPLKGVGRCDYLDPAQREKGPR